ncbi:DUF2845 domain-containing protein [Providencia sp. wls1950]|uniref:DUF2845 domain-containing protein n=1 Tax=Providencia sp. wls1950 TaxID=2675147 RepID=UPI0012B626B0|nr:DUF2845 domain-containing protein [Providencia sp. wls1950]
MKWIALIVLGFIMMIIWSVYSSKKRREYLLHKYGDETVVNMIMNRTFWIGQTSEQLLDSLGRPLDISSKVMKTRYREIWKYNKTGSNRYGLRITLDDGFVQGWDEK